MRGAAHRDAITERRVADALDFIRVDELVRLAELASSYWRSVGLAADRGDVLTVITHCKQVAAVTRALRSSRRLAGNRTPRAPHERF